MKPNRTMSWLAPSLFVLERERATCNALESKLLRISLSAFDSLATKFFQQKKGKGPGYFVIAPGTTDNRLALAGRRTIRHVT